MKKRIKFCLFTMRLQECLWAIFKMTFSSKKGMKVRGWKPERRVKASLFPKASYLLVQSMVKLQQPKSKE